jgi:hypothetical protein
VIGSKRLFVLAIGYIESKGGEFDRDDHECP